MATANELNFPDASVPKRSSTQLEPLSPLAAWARRVDSSHWKYWLVGGDMLLILVAFLAAYVLRYELQWFRAVDPVFQVDIWAYVPFALAMLIILPISFRFSGVYPYRRGRSLIEETYTIATATTAGVMVLIIASLFFRPLLYSRLIFFYTAVLVTLLLGFSRFAIQLAFSHLRRYGVGVKRMLLVGAGDVGRMVLRNVAARPDFGYRMIGFLDDNPAKGFTDIGPYRALGPVENLSQVLESEQVDTVVICLPWQSHRMIQRLLRTCETSRVRAQVVPDIFQATKNQVYVEQLNGIPLISTRELSIQGWNLLIKRASDLVLGTLLALVSMPLWLLIVAAIKLDSRGPILYSQTRIGKNGVPFRCFKFRSMVEDADELRHTLGEMNEASGPLFKMRDDPRRTRVGRMIRRFSLDELPQVLNVMRGEMSLVGPRPNLPQEVEQYQEWHRRRLLVSPGITGLWQVSGRSDLTFDEMVLLDTYYVENWNLAMDLSILLRSVPAVLRGRGAY
ncbi:MAG: sugar transferase [Caldilineaceae bacterium]|nr:sugar transferase [Caldilineaceae bacterium]